MSWCNNGGQNAIHGECSWFNPREEAVDGFAHGLCAVCPSINHSLNLFSPHGLFSGYVDNGLRAVSEVKTGADRSDNTEADYDPLRPPPKFYPKDKIFADAIIAEINGFVKNSPGRAALVVVDRFGAQYQKWPLIRPTLVVRRKGPLRAKARLCIRFDLTPIRDQMIAPTPFRSPMEVFMAICDACNFDVVSMVISHAFIQADELNIKDRIFSVAPDCIFYSWKKG